MGKRINYNENWQVRTGTKKKTFVNQKNMLNLQPIASPQSSLELDVWAAEVQAILKLSSKNPELKTELIIDAVVQKLAMKGAEKAEIANFLKFYLESDPTIIAKFRPKTR